MTTDPRVPHQAAATDAIVSVAVVVFTPENSYQVQVWQGQWDSNRRCWLNQPHGPRAESGYLPNNKELAFQFGAQMAADLGCVDLIAQHTN